MPETTALPLERGWDTSELKAIFGVGILCLAGIVFAGLAMLNGKLSVGDFIEFFKWTITCASSLTGGFAALRTWRKNSNERTVAKQSPSVVGSARKEIFGDD